MARIMKYVAASTLLIAVGMWGIADAEIAASAPAQAGAPAPAAASAADVKAGAAVRDSRGVPVATIVEIQGANVVLDTAQTKIAVPMTFLVKDGQGVMLNITADQFNAAILKAHARAEAARAAQAQQASPPPQQTQPQKH